jgi:hypothetical protein
VTLELIPLGPSAAPVVAATSAPAAAPATSHTRAWIALAATGALAAGAGTFALLSWNAKKDFEDELGRYPGNQDRIDRARSRTVKYAAITDGLAAAALVGAGVTIYFAISGDRRGTETTARNRVVVTPTLAGVTVTGGF